MMRTPRTLRSRARTATGFTLLEIMVVLVIFSMLMGIGIGAFSKVGGGPSMALGRIKDVVRTARFHAVREKAPGAVRVDPERNTVNGLGWKKVGCWHFEDDREGLSSGFPGEVNLDTAALHEGGVIGRCLDLAFRENVPRPKVAIASVPSLESVEGVAAECFIRLHGRGRRTVLAKGDAYRLGVDEEGRLFAALELMAHEATAQGEVSRITLESTDYTVPVGKWTRVGFQFNGYSLFLTAGGIVRNREHFKTRMRLRRHALQALVLGAGEFPFDGLLDELRLSAAVVGDDTPLKDPVRLSGDAPYTIHFDAKGFLDRDFHTRPVTIGFVHAGKSYRVTIGLMGEVQ